MKKIHTAIMFVMLYSYTFGQFDIGVGYGKASLNNQNFNYDNYMTSYYSLNDTQEVKIFSYQVKHDHYLISPKVNLSLVTGYRFKSSTKFQSRVGLSFSCNNFAIKNQNSNLSNDVFTTLKQEVIEKRKNLPIDLFQGIDSFVVIREKKDLRTLNHYLINIGLNAQMIYKLSNTIGIGLNLEMAFPIYARSERINYERRVEENEGIKIGVYETTVTKENKLNNFTKLKYSFAPLVEVKILKYFILQLKYQYSFSYEFKYAENQPNLKLNNTAVSLFYIL